MNPIKKVVNRLKDKVSEVKDKKDEQDNLKKWRDKFTVAKADYDLTLMDEREMLFRGTANVDRNINDKGNPVNGRKKANNVINIIYEFIEAQVDTTIPQPSVKAKRREYQEQAQVIEDSIKNDLTELGINKINDVNERITPIQGFSAIEVCWNPDFKHHLFRGEIELYTKHPKQLIPQPGVYELQKMDHFFLMSSTTKPYIKARYGVDLPSDGEQYPEVNTVGSDTYSTAEQDKVTEIIAFYKDKDGDIGKFVWTNNTILEDLPKFFYRQLERCTKCGAVKGSAEECKNTVNGTVCGNKKYKKTIEKTEKLINDIKMPDGKIIKKGTEIPYFKPSQYPIVIRENVPRNFAFGGESDVDVVRDQQDALKKVVSRIEEKIIKSGAIITSLNDHKVNITSELYQVIKGTQAELAAVNVKNLEATIQQDIEFARYMYESAQNSLGVTNSFLGKPDPTATSGVAKQMMIQQATGRMQSKLFNKQTAFKELFEIMFEFKLAYYDELRPYLKRTANGDTDWGDFNKYDFLAQDSAGEWYYNTDFLFTADAGNGLPKDKMWLMDQVKGMYKDNALDKLQYWILLDSLQFPMASEIKKQIEQEQSNSNPAPKDKVNVSINFKDLPMAGKIQAAAQAGIQLDQNTVQDPLQAPPGQPQTQPTQNTPQDIQGQQGQGQTQLPPELQNLPPETQQLLQEFPPEILDYLSKLDPATIAQFLKLSPDEQVKELQQMVGGGNIGQTPGIQSGAVQNSQTAGG